MYEDDKGMHVDCTTVKKNSLVKGILASLRVLDNYRSLCMIIQAVVSPYMCSSRKNPYLPKVRSLEIPRERGVLNVKNLEAKYEAKLEFPGGRGVQNKKPSVGGVWIFSKTAQCLTVTPHFCLDLSSSNLTIHSFR